MVNKRYFNLKAIRNVILILEYGEFDFIIVGGGSSGSVVANRLSEVSNWKILLLEAGDNNDEFTDIPYFFEPAANSDRNWGYFTVPQKNACLGKYNSHIWTNQKKQNYLLRNHIITKAVV